MLFFCVCLLLFLVLAESKKAFDDVDADQTGSVSLEESADMRCNDGLSRAEVETVFAVCRVSQSGGRSRSDGDQGR